MFQINQVFVYYIRSFFFVVSVFVVLFVVVEWVLHSLTHSLSCRNQKIKIPKTSNLFVHIFNNELCLYSFYYLVLGLRSIFWKQLGSYNGFLNGANIYAYFGVWMAILCLNIVCLKLVIFCCVNSLRDFKSHFLSLYTIVCVFSFLKDTKFPKWLKK